MLRRKKLFAFARVAIVALLVMGGLAGCQRAGSRVGTGSIERRDCVVMLGDSIFALTGAETRALQALSNQRYRTYYRNGAQMEGGGRDIEDQYDTAARAGSIRTIIMDGGGNDFLFGRGRPPAEIFAEISAAFVRIMDKAARDGVENLVVQGYYKTRRTPAGDDPAAGGAALEAAGAARGLNVVFVDPAADPYFQQRDPRQYTTDGLHPTREAAGELARLVWTAMQANNIEQGPGCS